MREVCRTFCAFFYIIASAFEEECEDEQSEYLLLDVRNCCRTYWKYCSLALVAACVCMGWFLCVTHTPMRMLPCIKYTYTHRHLCICIHECIHKPQAKWNGGSSKLSNLCLLAWGEKTPRWCDLKLSMRAWVAILIFLKRNNGCFHRVWLWGSSFKFDQKNMFWKHKRAAEGPVPWRPAVPRLSDGDYAMICKMKQTASLVDFLFSSYRPLILPRWKLTFLPPV